MNRPALLRRRHIWVPTIWGWLALALAGAVLLWLGLHHVHSFLAPNQPVGARLLVIEGWMPAAELDQALRIEGLSRYERIVTTGGPIAEFEGGGGGSYADRARQYLVKRGLAAAKVTAVPAPASAQDRSFLNAVMVREWAADSKLEVDSLDVFSSGVHSRRSRHLYRLAFGDSVPVGILAAEPSTYDADAWWRTSVGAKEVLGESIAWLWTELFFHPPPAGSAEERWGASH